MPRLPSALFDTIKNILGFDPTALMHVHEKKDVPVSIRLNPMKPCEVAFPFYGEIPWCASGRYLKERPAFIFDPLLHGGAYYVQEASSMFVAHAFNVLHDDSQEHPILLDLCAAPGGKSTLLQSVLSENGLLVSNEVIRQRAGILEENLTKWGGSNTVVTNNDPVHFQKLPGFFDGMLIDAPCSGSGLFRKDPDAILEWSLDNVALCSQRQQRILADAWPALKENGWLIYATCSYSSDENEVITDWVLENLNAEPVDLNPPPEWGITGVISPLKKGFGYRFFPYNLAGEGFYISCFRKRGETGSTRVPSGKKNKSTVPDTTALKSLLQTRLEPAFIPVGDEVTIVPAWATEKIAALQSRLYIKKAGVLAGKPSPKGWIPDHALATSTLLSPEIPGWDLNLEQAIAYLRRDEVPGMPSFTGWGLARYGGISLGWIKAMPNRINNYYPTHWRVLKRNEGQ